MSRSWGLLTALCLMGLIGYYWPTIAPTTLADPFVASKSWLSVVISVTMFVLGSLLPRDEVRALFRCWPKVLAGTFVQCTAMPLAAWFIASVSGLSDDLKLGLILVGVVPGAMASNVVTLASGGNVSYSISLTLAATMLSPLTIPLLLQLLLGTTFPSSVELLSPWKLGGNLLATVALPVALGYFLSLRIAGVAAWAKRFGPLFAEGAILWIVTTVVALNRDRLAEISPTVLWSLLAVNILGYASGWFAATALRMDPPMRRALTIEVGMQNAGLGSVLALALFPDSPQAAIPTAGYTFGCVLTGTLLAAYWNFINTRKTNEQQANLDTF